LATIPAVEKSHVRFCHFGEFEAARKYGEFLTREAELGLDPD
jgi:hypothetical protein